MTDDTAGQVQSRLNAGGKKWNIENTPKYTRPNFIPARQSSLGLEKIIWNNIMQNLQ